MSDILAFGYSIRDVNKAIKNRIKQEDLSVDMEGIDTRLQVLEGTPDEMITNKKYPVIYINPGYEITTPKIWKVNGDIIEQISDRDDKIIERISIEYVSMFYTYQIGFMVDYQSHCDELVWKFIQMFPNDFYMGFQDAEVKNYKLLFNRDEEIVNLDEIVEDQKIYRRDILVTTRLVVPRYEYEATTRAYEGVVVDVMNINDL